MDAASADNSRWVDRGKWQRILLRVLFFVAIAHPGVFLEGCGRAAPAAEEPVGRPPEEVQAILRRLEESDPTDRIPKGENLDAPVIAQSVRSDPAAVEKAVAELAAGSMAAALPDKLAPLPLPPSGPTRLVPQAAGARTVGTGQAPAAETTEVRPDSLPLTAADKCRALYSKCDGRTPATDVCVRDLPQCGGADPAAPCCPTECVEDYKARRREGQTVNQAGEAVFGGQGHVCLPSP